MEAGKIQVKEGRGQFATSGEWGDLEAWSYLALPHPLYLEPQFSRKKRSTHEAGKAGGPIYKTECRGSLSFCSTQTLTQAIVG